MKNTFAKLFDLGEHQVLLEKDFNLDKNGKDEFIMKITTSLDEVKSSIKANYFSEQKRDEQFEKYSKDNAQNFLDQMILTLENNN
jgi:hypothetical protein